MNLAVLLMGLAVHAQSAEEGEPKVPRIAPVESVEIPGVSPLSRAGKVLFGGQPNTSALNALASRGLTKVVDLRLADEARGFDEAATAKRLGLSYVTLPFGKSDALSDELLDRGRTFLRDHRANGKGDLLIHGASPDRACAIWLTGRVLDEGVALKTAVTETRAAGLRSKALETIARHYISGGGNQALGRAKTKYEEEFDGVPAISVNELRERLADEDEPPVLLIDARAEREFAVSHLAGAHRATSAREVLALLRSRPEDTEVVCYCSIGVRSAKLTKSLVKAGCGGAKNLEGSIFEWANRGLPVVRDGKPVREVHPYNAKWGKLLRSERHPRKDGK